jgi:hypothetical protein
MLHPSVRSWLPGRGASLVLGVLVLAGLLAGLTHRPNARADGQNSKKPAGKRQSPNTKGSAAKEPAKLPSLKLTITSKDPDVADTVKVINEKIRAGWTANKVTPAQFVDDYEFIRRATLDIIGRIARPGEIQQYLKDPKDRRRSLLIERLLASQDYPRHWANLWSTWLVTRSGQFGRGAFRDQLSLWLKDQFATNKTYDHIVTKLITARGKNTDTDNGVVNFLLAHLGDPVPEKHVQEEGQFEMVPLTSRITRLFLGIQVQCAQCHSHPFHGVLKQEQFWGVNAFLRQLRRTPPPARRGAAMMASEYTLDDDDSLNSEAVVPYEERNGKIRLTKAAFLPPPGKESGPRLSPKITGVARRQELAKYLIEHESFPRAIVNRMWGQFFGRGFVNPVDDFNDNNQPSHPELLNELASRIKHYNYDLKKLIRWITHSDAYHLSYVANKTNDKAEHETLFSRMVMKAMTPEQLFESLMVSTGAPLSDTAEGKKLRDAWLQKLVANFGDDEGNEVNFNGTVVQALLMMNGDDIHKAITRPGGTVSRAMQNSRGKVPNVINAMYMLTLNRPARPAEMRKIGAMMKLNTLETHAKDSFTARFEDLFWALLNSNEFILNH